MGVGSLFRILSRRLPKLIETACSTFVLTWMARRLLLIQLISGESMYVYLRVDGAAFPRFPALCTFDVVFDPGDFVLLHLL